MRGRGVGRRDRGGGTEGAIGPGVLAGMWDVVGEFWKVYQVTNPPLPSSQLLEVRLPAPQA